MGRLRARMAGLDAFTTDVLLALALAGFAVVEVCFVYDEAAERLVGSAVVVSMAVPLAFRRRATFAALLGVAAIVTAWEAGGSDHSPAGLEVSGSILLAVVATYSAGAYLTGRRRWIVALAFEGGMVANGAGLSRGAAGLFDDLVFETLFLIAGPMLVGAIVGGERRLAAELAERNRELERERERRARLAVETERGRITRELHDVVAHSVSVMVVQAGAARTVIGTDPGGSRRAFGAIEATGREALGELRRLLGVLHPNGGASELLPRPGLAGLDRLVERARAAGLDVRLEVSGEADVPAAVGDSAYRVVQEALTNVLKHAGPTRALVSVSLAGAAVEVSVRNERGAATPPLGQGAGHGLVGMRERAAQHGGTLEAHALDDGGFLVRARLPLGAGAPA